MESKPTNDKQIKKLLTFVDDSGFAIFEELQEINDKLGSFIEEEVKKGEQGEPGPQGEPGIDGIDGKDGSPGKDGIDGQDGADGIDGENGKDGSPDTPLQIKEKLLSLSEEDKLKLKDLGGFDALMERIDRLGLRKNTIVPQSGITTTFFSLNGAVKGRAKNINFISGSTLDVVLNGDTATITIPTGGGGGGESLAQTLAIGNSTGGNDIVVSTGDQIIGQTNLLVSNSTGNSFSNYTSGYALHQWGNGIIDDHIIQGNGTVIYSDTYISLQTTSGQYFFLNGSSVSGLFDFSGITTTRTYTMPNASGTLALTSQLTPVSFGTVGQIPFTNAGGTDFDYSGSLSFNGARMLLTGAGTGQVGALHINRGDSVNQYIVLQENAASPGSAYITFAGSNPGAMAMGAAYSGGVPIAYVFTDTSGTPLVTIDEGTGQMAIASLTASEIVLTDASKNLVSASVATYPSLTELAFLKGATSAVQTQLDGKAQNGQVAVLDFTVTAAITGFSSTTTERFFYSYDPNTKICHCYIEVSGTSNATSITCTLPFTSAAIGQSSFGLGVTDNSTPATVLGGTAISAGSTTCTFRRNRTTTSWTASNTKAILGNFQYMTA